MRQVEAFKYPLLHESAPKPAALALRGDARRRRWIKLGNLLRLLNYVGSRTQFPVPQVWPGHIGEAPGNPCGTARHIPVARKRLKEDSFLTRLTGFTG